MTLFDDPNDPVAGRAPVPGRVHVAACRPWFEAERTLVEPRVLVCLGATAAQALLGASVRIGRDRGRSMESDLAPLVMVTTHPSAILRRRDDQERARAMDAFVADLESVARWLEESEGSQHIHRNSYPADMHAIAVHRPSKPGVHCPRPVLP